MKNKYILFAATAIMLICANSCKHDLYDKPGIVTGVKKCYKVDEDNTKILLTY